MPPETHRTNPLKGTPTERNVSAVWVELPSTINSRKRKPEGIREASQVISRHTEHTEVGDVAAVAQEVKRASKRAKRDAPAVPLKERGPKAFRLTPNSDLNAMNLHRHFASLGSLYSAGVARWFQDLGGVQHYPVCINCKENQTTHECKPSPDKDGHSSPNCIVCVRRHLACSSIFAYRLWLAHMDTGLPEERILAVMEQFGIGDSRSIATQRKSLQTPRIPHAHQSKGATLAAPDNETGEEELEHIDVAQDSPDSKTDEQDSEQIEALVEPNTAQSQAQVSDAVGITSPAVRRSTNADLQSDQPGAHGASDSRTIAELGAQSNERRDEVQNLKDMYNKLQAELALFKGAVQQQQRDDILLKDTNDKLRAQLKLFKEAVQQQQRDIILLKDTNNKLRAGLKLFKEAVQQQRRDDGRLSYAIAGPLEGFVTAQLELKAIDVVNDGLPLASETVVFLQQESARHLEALVAASKGRVAPISELIRKAPFEWPLSLHLPPVE